MISLTITDAQIALYADEIHQKILKHRLDNALDPKKNKKGTLKRFEIKFYESVRKDVPRLLSLTPAEIEQEFAGYLVDHLDYVVFASGDLDRIVAHIPAKDFPFYEQEWKKHVAPPRKNAKKPTRPKPCKCNFCVTSRNARLMFNWPDFTEKDKKVIPSESIAGRYVKSVGATVCPYCSRNYISPIGDKDDNIYRPDLDHFYARSIYPYFGLCLRNLVPSCAACNCRIKNNVDFMFKKIFHPYQHEAPEDLFVLDGTFIVDKGKAEPSSMSVRINTAVDEPFLNGAAFFHLDTAYATHITQACDFVNSLNHLTDEWLEERAELLGLDKHYLKDVLHRSRLEDKETYKTRALGKMFRDIYNYCKTDLKR